MLTSSACPDDPAFGGSYTIDFTKGASDFFDVADGTTLEYDETNGAVFTIAKDTDAPTVTSNKYMFFGTLEVVMQAAPGTGIVSSIVLESDDLDEIDWEWLGGDTAQVQTNYFSKGDTSTYDRGGYSAIANPQSTFNTYTIDWSPEAVVWSIDGKVVRTLTSASAGNGKTFPQTPMQIKLGTWDAGAAASPTGTVQWAGGYTPFGSGSGAPYKAYYKSVKVTDRSNGVSGATSYTYGDDSGDYTSIVVNTDGSSDSSSSATTKATTAKATSTKAGTGAATATGTDAAASGSATDASTLVTATGTKTASTKTTATTAAGAASGTGAVASSTSVSVVTNGAGKVGAGIFGAAAAAMAAFALL